MRKIEKYVIPRSRMGSEVITRIQELIEEGWQPWGGLCMSTCDNRTIYAQAMVKYAQAPRLATSS